MTPVTFPDAAGAFTLTPDAAAYALDLTRTELLDLTRSGCAFALLMPANLVSDRPPLRYAPGLLADVRDRLESRNDELRAAEVRLVAATLRDYLDTHHPVEDYAEARKRGVPVLARNNSHEVLAHVDQRVLVDLVFQRAPLAGPAAYARMPSHLAAALERLGCTAIRGLRAVGDTRQHWHAWWRVPRSMWSADQQWADDVSDWPALRPGGMTEPTMDSEDDTP